MANDQISLSTLVVLVIVSGLFYKYILAASASTSASGLAQPSHEAAAHRSREEAVERIQQVFPHIARRTLLWDLQRPGGSLQNTMERILSERLETPPASFQPPPPPPRTVSTAAPTQSRQSAKQSEKKAPTDLITRYNLGNRVGATAAQPAAAAPAGWSANKDERQAALTKRRDDMILAARKKMEAKIAAEKSAAPCKGGH